MPGGSRAANAAIAGYLYQFELSALRLLRTGDDDLVTIEGIEDTDLASGARTELVQCKYFAASTYSLASLRDALLPMLRTFAQGNNFEYTLYVHFGGNEQPPERLTLDELRECLTEKKRKPDAHVIEHWAEYGTTTLEGFLTRLRVASGPSLDEQRQRLYHELQTALKCEAADVEEVHYGRCLALVIDMARQKSVADRTITRSSFLRALDNKPVIFDRWHREYLGEEKTLARLASFIKRIGAWKHERLILVLLSTNREDDVASLLVEFSARMRPNRRNLVTNVPVCVGLDGDHACVDTMKVRLAEGGLNFNDGLESLGFFPRVFNALPVVHAAGATRAISRASYDIRVASLQTLTSHAHELARFYALISFGVLVPESLRGQSQFCVEVPLRDPERIREFLGRLK